jgi:hypothetical protein
VPATFDNWTQDTGEVAVQRHPELALSVADVFPPAIPTTEAPGESAKVQAVLAPAACVTVTVLPATVTVPVRELVLVLPANASVTDPFPLPEAGSTVIHAVPVEAVQAHPADVVTATLAVPGPAAADTDVGDTA